MVPYKIIKIKETKTVYKVVVRDGKGKIVEQWLDRNGIDFIDPSFLAANRHTGKRQRMNGRYNINLIGQ